MSSSRYIIVLLMLLLVPALLFGAIIAIYTPELSIYLQVHPGPYTSDTVIGAKLGTLKVTTTDGDQIHSPTWGSTGEVANGVDLTGPMWNKKNGSYTSDTHTFHVMSVAYPNGYSGTPIIRLISDTYEPIVQQSAYTVTTNPFYVELWLLNTHKTQPNATVGSGSRPASDFEEGAAYSLPSDFGPYFSFITANDDSTNVNKMMNKTDGTPNSDGSYVDVNGLGGGPDSTPIIDPNAYTDPNNPGEPGMTYGDPPQIVSYSVFLSEQTKTFNLSEAAGTNRKDVNTMSITVNNGTSGVDYSQKVIFTDLTPISTSPNFRMLPEESGPTPIPFKLYFDSMEVIKGEAITWNNLQNGSNSPKTIQIGGIDQNIIDSLASGTYSDTISVEIQNP